MANIPGYSKTARPFGEREVNRVGDVRVKVYIIYRSDYPDYEYMSEYDFRSYNVMSWTETTNYNNIPSVKVGDLYNWRKIQQKRTSVTRVATSYKTFDDSLEEKLGGSRDFLGGV